MEAARQRVRAAAAHKKEEERKAKGKEGTSSSAPKAAAKGSVKRKGDGVPQRRDQLKSSFPYSHHDLT